MKDGGRRERDGGRECGKEGGKNGVVEGWGRKEEMGKESCQ